MQALRMGQEGIRTMTAAADVLGIINGAGLVAAVGVVTVIGLATLLFRRW